MQILYYNWFENSKDDMIASLRELGHEVQVTTECFTDYNSLEEATRILGPIFNNFAIDAIFSFNYFPAIAEFSHQHSVSYLSWVYDCPHLTLFSNTVRYPENHIFLFDQKMCEMVRSFGAIHAHHLPLAANVPRLSAQLAGHRDDIHPVSFVGSLYTNNMFDQIRFLPNYVSGYLDGIISAQQQLWGCNLISELLTEDLTEELCKYIKLSLPDDYLLRPRDIFADMICKKIASKERQRLLQQIRSSYDLSLYTNPDEALPAGLTTLGYADYNTQMPFIFRGSRINLNISLRSIESGIPLRAIDIMACGGFLLSNYQPELDQYFVAGEEYDFFINESDMMNKIDYYLSHDEKRRQIAEQGRKKVAEQFSYSSAIASMLRACNLAASSVSPR